MDTSKENTNSPASETIVTTKHIQGWVLVEKALQSGFGKLGERIAAYPRSILLTIFIALVSLGFGILTAKVETDPLKLWIDQGTKLIDQLNFYEDNFDGYRTQSFIIRPKPTSSLLDKAAWDEVYKLHEFIQKPKFSKDGQLFDFDDICYKALDSEDSMPCLMLSPLDCFREGGVLIPGGANNTKYNNFYDGRQSYRSADWDFSQNLTLDYLTSFCASWYNIPLPHSASFGGITFGHDSVVEKLDALHVAFFSKDARTLRDKGVRWATWADTPEGQQRDQFNCPLGQSPPHCPTCLDGFNAEVGLTFGCIPEDRPQPERCCDEFVAPLIDHPCLGDILASDASFLTVGGFIIQQCGYDIPPLPASRCTLRPDNASTAFCTQHQPTWQQACQPGRQAGDEECCEVGRQHVGTGCADCNADCDAACQVLVAASQSACAGSGLPNISSEYICQETSAVEGNEGNLTSQSCDSKVSAWRTACEAAEEANNAGTLDLLNGLNCCVFGSQLGSECVCSEAFSSSFTSTSQDITSCDQQDNLCYLLYNQAQCRDAASSLGYEVPSCSDPGSSSPAAPPTPTPTSSPTASPTTSSSSSSSVSGVEGCTAGCGALEGNPCLEECQTTGCAFWYGEECSANQTFTVPIDNFLEISSESEALQILEGWETAWLDEFEEFQRSLSHVDIYYFAGKSLSDVLEDASAASVPLLITGYCLLSLYLLGFFLLDLTWQRGPAGVQSAMCRVNTVPPRITCAMSALCGIAASTFASLGVAGLFCAAGLRFDPTTYQVLPFLSLGLGINDFFVLAAVTRRALAARGPSANSNPYKVRDVMQAVMKDGGVSVTLSSGANACAFLLGALSSIPAVRNFAVLLGLTVVMNYLTSLLLQPALLALDVGAALRGQHDPLMRVGHAATATCGRDASRVTASPPEVDPSGNESQTLMGRLADALFLGPNSAGLRLGVSAAYLGFLALCLYGCTQVDRGLEAVDAIPSSSYVHDWAYQLDKYFNTYQINLVYRNVDYPNQMQELISLEYDMVHEGRSTETTYNVTSGLRYYMEYTEAKYCTGAICDVGAEGNAEVQWVWDHFAADQDICRNIRGNSTEARAALCREKCSFGSTESHCPQHPTDPALRCQLSGDGGQLRCSCPYRVVPSAATFYTFLPSFFQEGLRGEVGRSLIQYDDQSGTIDAAYTIFFVQDVDNLESKLRHIRRARDIADSSGLDAFPFDYAVYAVNEQYLHIWKTLGIVVGAGIAGASVVVCVLLGSPSCVALVVLALLLTQLQLYGLLPLLGMKLNAVVVVNMVVAVGFSIEAICHVARHCMLAQGGGSERAAEALKRVGGAVMHGGVTTLLSILAIAFSDYEYFRIYYFFMYMAIVVVSLLNGIVFLPIIFSITIKSP